ncbi:MAG: glycosyltransferase family 4 protein [Acidimicrobiaceae bacterium]|nr:glycosyltransferase family 4 protein [Acidimicrobiaceae bacterium]
MGRPLKIGLYSPFFGSTYGGGEKYLGVTAEALRDAYPEADVEILSPVRPDLERYQQMLGLDLTGVGVRAGNPRPGRLKRVLAGMPSLRLYRNLVVSAQAAGLTAEYDLFLSMVYVLPAATRARGSVILCQFPYDVRQAMSKPGVPRLAWALYTLPYRLLQRRLLGGEVDDFQLVICQAEYVRGWVRRLWGRDSVVVNPPIDVPESKPDWSAKERVVLSVGRFFTGGHSKRQDLMAQAFRELCDGGNEGWHLHLVGSLNREHAADVEYFHRVRRLAEGYPIWIHPDAPGETVLDLYRRASIYWHAAGYGVDAELRPAELEHFGMTTAEAMGYGAVPVAIGRGGQVEVVEDGVSGYLWRDLDELKARTMGLMGDPPLRRRLGEEARRASERFDRASFKRKMVDAVAPLVKELGAEQTSSIPP